MNEERTYIHELPNGYCRGVTEEELRKGLLIGAEYKKLVDDHNRIEGEINIIKTNCNHGICYDKGGFLYDIRTCVVCGHTSLI